MSSLAINHFLLGNRLLLAHSAATFGENFKIPNEILDFGCYQPIF